MPTTKLLPNEVFDIRKFIATYDLTEVINRLVSKRQLKRAQASEAVEAYRHFMLLVWTNYHTRTSLGDQTGAVVPSALADIVWHGHILHTKKYRKFCQSLIGQFIDHAPNPPDMTEAEMFARRDHTRQLQQIVPDRLWFVSEFLPPEGTKQAGCAGCDCG